MIRLQEVQFAVFSKWFKPCGWCGLQCVCRGSSGYVGIISLSFRDIDRQTRFLSAEAAQYI